MATLDNCYNIFDMREAAKRRLPRGIFEFVDRATEDHLAVTDNRAGFQDIKLRHRALVDVSGRSTKPVLFGKEVSLPMIIAATGAAGLCWYRGELQLAKDAAKAAIPFAMSTASMTAMEEAAVNAGGRLWFQLYVWKRRDLSYQVIEGAKKAGYEALIVTVDSAVSLNREYNARNGFSAPLKPNFRMAVDIALHPGWSLRVMGRYLRTTGMPKQENFPPEFQESITRGVGDRADGMRRDLDGPCMKTARRQRNRRMPACRIRVAIGSARSAANHGRSTSTRTASSSTSILPPNVCPIARTEKVSRSSTQLLSTAVAWASISERMQFSPRSSLSRAACLPSWCGTMTINA